MSRNTAYTLSNQFTLRTFTLTLFMDIFKSSSYAKYNVHLWLDIAIIVFVLLKAEKTFS